MSASTTTTATSVTTATSLSTSTSTVMSSTMSSTMSTSMSTSMMPSSSTTLMSVPSSSSSWNGTWAPTTIVDVVTQWTTWCPEPTSFEVNGNTYVVTSPTVVTITDCPCTVTHVNAAVPAPTGSPAPAWSASPATPEYPTSIPVGSMPVATAGASTTVKSGVAVLATALLALFGMLS